MRPSAKTSIFAPTRCGVEPVVDTIVTSAAGSPRSSASATAAKTSWFICCDYTRVGSAGQREVGGRGRSASRSRDSPRCRSVQLARPRSARCRRGTLREMTLRAARGRRACRSRGRCRRTRSRRAPSNGTLARPASARFMNCVQIGSAAWAPLRPTGWLSSKPTQTTVSSSGVKPTNQASRRSLVVPVLPAASSVKPAAARAGRRCPR